MQFIIQNFLSKQNIKLHGLQFIKSVYLIVIMNRINILLSNGNLIRATETNPRNKEERIDEEFIDNNRPLEDNNFREIKEVKDAFETAGSRELTICLYTPQIIFTDSQLFGNHNKFTAGDFYRDVISNFYACEMVGLENLKFLTGHLEKIDEKKVLPFVKDNFIYKLMKLHIEKQDASIKNLRHILECINEIRSRPGFGCMSILQDIFSVGKLLYRLSDLFYGIGGFISSAFSCSNSITSDNNNERGNYDFPGLYSTAEINYFQQITRNAYNRGIDQTKYLDKFRESFTSLFALIPILLEADIKGLLEMNVNYKHIYDGLDKCFNNLFIDLNDFFEEFETLNPQSTNDGILQAIKTENKNLSEFFETNGYPVYTGYCFARCPKSTARMLGICFQITSRINTSLILERQLDNPINHNFSLLPPVSDEERQNNKNSIQSNFMGHINMFTIVNQIFSSALDNYITQKTSMRVLIIIYKLKTNFGIKRANK